LVAFYVLNIDLVNSLLSQYISNPQVLALVVAGLLFLKNEISMDFSKKDKVV
jgi:hypothetical protein